MKTEELFCASPSSTAICSSMDQRSIIRRGIGRSNEHHNNNRRHGHLPPPPRPSSKTTKIPCSSQIPFSPATTHSLDKLRRKNYCTNSTNSTKPTTTNEVRRKSLISPPSQTSSRYLLSDNSSVFDFLSESVKTTENETQNHKALGEGDKQLFNYLEELPVFRSSSARSIESPVYKSSLSHAMQSKSKDLIAFKGSKNEMIAYESSSNQSQNQVVELKVSIHCKGCEAKIRKHISRMEGVSRISIDLAIKKVTVEGNVTPLSVLSRVSKVKYAEFWSSPSSTAAASSSSMSSPRV